MITPKTSIQFTDNTTSVTITVDGVQIAVYAKNKFSIYPNPNAGADEIDLKYVEQEMSDEIFFRFNYTQILPLQPSKAAAVSYLAGIFFLASVGNGGSPTFTDLVVNGYTKLGELGSPFKVAFFDATFPSSQGIWSLVYLTGLDASKIVTIIVNGMWASNGGFMSNQFHWATSYEYDWYMGNGINPPLYLCLSSFNSLSLVDKPVKITVFYTA